MAGKRVEIIDNGIGKQVVPFMFSKANCNALGKSGIMKLQCIWKVTTQKLETEFTPMLHGYGWQKQAATEHSRGTSKVFLTS